MNSQAEEVIALEHIWLRWVFSGQKAELACVFIEIAWE